jgi:hypothetical protein
MPPLADEGKKSREHESYSQLQNKPEEIDI